MNAPAPSAGDIDAVRRFTRFYTRQVGLLERTLLNSSFSLTEARVLYELAHGEGVTAAGLCDQLRLDAGYLSRILKKFEADGLLARTASPHDRRQSVLTLTAAGRAAFAPLERSSAAEVAAMLGALPADARGRLVAAMGTVERLLGAPPAEAAPYRLRGLRPGDIGWVIHRQAVLYHREYGFDATFEALIAGILGEFATHFDPACERAWIAERDGETVGSVFLVRATPEVAKLRLLYVEPAARGLGIGGRLVEECVAFARSAGYGKLTLWTNDVLVAARRIYQAAGFTLVKEEKHHSFGRDLVGQHWDLVL
ncbi:helix-turn-helix domain-containing GNAT family N-acetyltransferase [Aquibium sp. A9E412]|uniref:bifunctional helix-turn-helix transcriptional regulator/GNAT family N-acetyltransferase n=1 Tax=Aquibium sp. A9E412 TaxID=2976767 RepID=UPI0025B177D5|nr:helix-turn-helix domain-containing GNAT family N-acetyltransferase [Aquibium sp. A9E412]MDN2566986.1 helix-turn-helix domain-containing GNAT family N-acetyltransferase [Aquibium sp. A9E412]